MRDNLLAENGRWIGVKAQMGRYVLGGVSYLVTRPALAYDRLNLAAWHGFQEMLYQHALRPRHVAFDVVLTPGSYVDVLYNVTDRGFSGIRVRGAQSERFTAKPDGQFLTHQPISLPAGRHVDLDLNHADLGYVGFRGSLLPSAVDNVRITADDGSVVTETFDHYHHRVRLASLIFLALLAGNGLLYALARWQRQPSLLPFMLMVGMLGAMGSGAVWGWQWFIVGPRYPSTIDYNRYPQYQKYVREVLEGPAIVDEVAHRYPRHPTPGRPRIMFVGSSQTWGSGADSEADIWVRRVERALGDVECVNCGVCGLTSERLLALYRNYWMRMQPQLVVIDLAFNDTDPQVLAANLRRFCTLNAQHGIRTLLIPEPCCNEAPNPGMVAKHAAVAAVAHEMHVDLLEMQPWMDSHAQDGYLWWDWVHLTTFGQALFAERLTPVLRQLMAAPAPDRATAPPR
ncbi:MAG: SGNH/GDSL hydrolase family protein [Candidatus Xenobia bacterium]